MKQPNSFLTIDAGPESIITDKLAGLDAVAGDQAENDLKISTITGGFKHDGSVTTLSVSESSEATEWASDEFRNSPNGGRDGIQYGSEPT